MVGSHVRQRNSQRGKRGKRGKRGLGCFNELTSETVIIGMHPRHVIVAMTVALAGSLEGQSTTCVSPKRLSDGCRTFVFFDGAGAAALIRGAHGNLRVDPAEDLPSYAGGLVGVMRNVDSVSAVGVSAEFDYAFTGRASLKTHYRRWLVGRTSVDLSAGPLLVDIFETEGRGDTRIRARGATADLAVVERHGLGLFVGADLIEGDHRSSTGLHVGARAEGAAAALAAAVVGGLFAAVWLR